MIQNNRDVAGWENRWTGREAVKDKKHRRDETKGSQTRTKDIETDTHTQ